MRFQFAENELTDHEFIQWLNFTHFQPGIDEKPYTQTYLIQLSTQTHLSRYCGKRRIRWTIYPQLGNLRVWTIEGVVRKEAVQSKVLLWEPPNNRQIAALNRPKKSPVDAGILSRTLKLIKDK